MSPQPTPDPWIADGYELRQKHGRMIAYFGPHHTPPNEYPLSCRLQDEANAQWVAAAPATIAKLRKQVRVLEEAAKPFIEYAKAYGACTGSELWASNGTKLKPRDWLTLAATKEGA